MVTTNGNGSLLSREAFSALVAERVEQLPEIEIISRSERDLELEVRGLPIRAGLENFYAAYAQNPALLDTVVQNFIEAALGFVPNRGESDYDALAERIFPMLKPIKILATVAERKVPMLAWQQFLADLIVTYVIDEPQSVVFVNEAHLERWGVAQVDLHAQALANLRRRTQEERDYTSVGEGEQRLFIWNTNDGYDATRLLLTDVLARWQRELGGQVVIGIPNRDFLIALGTSDRTVLGNIAKQVQFDAANQPFGLTDQLFTVADGQIREFDWD
jgi:uncharacterized protein YtpQ (UPF0354 family)